MGELHKYGINANLVEGYVQLDEVDLYSEEAINRFVYNDDIFKAVHFWVGVNSKILDLTANQFAKELVEILPSMSSCFNKKQYDIMYGNPDSYHRLSIINI